MMLSRPSIILIKTLYNSGDFLVNFDIESILSGNVGAIMGEMRTILI